MIDNRSRAFWCGLVVVCLLALVPRVVYSVSRPMQWYLRAASFWKALLDGDLASTYQQYHPGVTTMWIAGLGMQVYAVAHGWSGDELLDPPRPSPTSVDFKPYPVEAGVIALGIAISLCVCLAYVLLVRLLGWRIGFIGGCLLALDPMYLAESKVLHVDALLATLMLLSALSLVAYLQLKRLWWLVLSGVFAGLAFLTKSPAIFLVPYAALGVICRHFCESVVGSSSGHILGTRIVKVVRDLMMWVFVVVGVFVICWPAMWVMPGDVLEGMLEGSGFHAEIEHQNPNFFAGQVTYEDVGPVFYLATVAWKTTAVTLLAFLAAVILLLRRVKLWADRKPLWGLLVYIGGFVLMMTLAAGKEMRYVLPVFLALDVLAAWGLDRVASALGKLEGRLTQIRRPAVIIAALLVIQAIVVLRHHPYYGVHHNLLLGGSQVAQHVLPLGDQGEGADAAARFLNSYPGAERRTAGVHRRLEELSERMFVGNSIGMEKPGVDYYVFAVNNIQRHNRAEYWEGAWEACQEKEPLWSVSFEGIPYVWIYPAYPSEPEVFAIDNSVDAQLGDHIRLLGYRSNAGGLSAGEAPAVSLFWQSDGRVVGDYHVFVHLISTDGQMVGQDDSVPVQGTRPTWDWRDREVLQDEHTLAIAGDLPGGTYALSVGMYDLSTGTRLPAVGPDGVRLPEDRIVLDTIQVMSP
jgi:hypothetical protein